MNTEKVIIEFQYFEGCPNVPKLWEALTLAIEGIEDKIQISKVLVDDQQKAEFYKFRGSPTLLINGTDFGNMPEPAVPALSCRYYANGIPTKDELRKKILQLFSN